MFVNVQPTREQFCNLVSPHHLVIFSFCHPVILSSQPGSSNLSLDCSRLTEGQIQLVCWPNRSWIQLIEFPANWSSPSPHGVRSVKLISRSPPLHIEMLGLVHSLWLTSMCLNICQKQISSNNFIKVVLDHRGLYSVNTQNSKRIWNLISKGAKGQDNWPLGVGTFGSWVQHSLMQYFKLIFNAPQSSNGAKLKQGPIIINMRDKNADWKVSFNFFGWAHNYFLIKCVNVKFRWR